MEATIPGGGAAAALSQQQIATAMKSPGHLKQWLDATGRRWIVFNGVDLIDALPWPHGIEAFMQVTMAYRDYRRTIATGRVQKVAGKHPLTGVAYDQEFPVYRDENLEVEELDRAIRSLVGKILELDPAWSLEGAAL